MHAATEQMGSDKTAVRPFRVDVPEAELTELRRRIKATRWPEKETAWEEPLLFASEMRAAFKSLQ